PLSAAFFPPRRSSDLRARTQLDAVADDVVLPSEDLERIPGFERFEFTLRHRERVVAEVDLLQLLVVLEHRIVDDPAEPERLFQKDRKSTRLNSSHVKI